MIKAILREPWFPDELSKLLKREGRAEYGKLVATPIVMELPYVGHQMLNFILI